MRVRSRKSGASDEIRYGLLLRMVGRTAEARVIFNELLLQMKRAEISARRAGGMACDCREVAVSLSQRGSEEPPACSKDNSV